MSVTVSPAFGPPSSLDALIGRTPLYQLRRFRPGGAALFVKLEQFNPGGSLKDRTALGMIQRAESEGALRPGMRIIESSSGNTAIGLAMLAVDRDCTVTAICDRHLPAAKRGRLRALGAEIVFLPETPPGTDTVELRIAVANSLARTVPNAMSLGQYSNPANPNIHYRTTGPEIWSAVNGRMDAVVIAVGTCGTISGVGRYVKEQDARVRVIGVEPAGSIIFGGADEPYFIQGGGLSFIPSILDRSVIDDGRKVCDRDAIAAAHELALTEGWMVGGTGGLVAHVLGELAYELDPGAKVVGIIPDGGERYLDTLYDEQWLADHAFDAQRGRGDSGDNALGEAVRALGCTLNGTNEAGSLPVNELCRRVGATHLKMA